MPVSEGTAVELAYWIVAALLALFYLHAGGKKVTQSQERLQPMMGWVDRVPMPLVRAIGVLEVLGAVGLVLPPLTGIAVRLAIVAAVGLVLIQIGGIAVHLSRSEARLIGLNIVLLVAAAATAWLGTVWL
ncbi:DoxX family protein [Micromonospora vulcania]|uniref:DoxX family protein n=1 Tax=Micromonospora vulcania TaxID=1441873 RepID=A0ABW1H0Q9_9ACTN